MAENPANTASARGLTMTREELICGKCFSTYAVYHGEDEKSVRAAVEKASACPCCDSRNILRAHA
jgi:hypothetical protein